MSETSASLRNHDAGAYEIRVAGHLDRRWDSSFAGWVLTQDADGTTLLRGRAADQAALHGLLQRMRDLGLRLVSVIETDQG